MVNPRKNSTLVFGWTLAVAALMLIPRTASAAKPAEVIHAGQQRSVKIYGAGGLRGLDAYQSGFLISAEGHIVTVFNHVLDSDVITVTLDDGRKFKAQLLGADPRLEVAVLKIDAADLPFFDLHQAATAAEGTAVLAFSNLFGIATGDEPVSVQHGVISAVAPLAARRGAFETPYQGPVYVLDAMTNNPGAAGGALTNVRGQLLGMLGLQLRNAQNNSWLNYAVPVNEIVEAVEAIKAGQTRPANAHSARQKPPENPLTLADLGIVLVPNVLERTPPFVDTVRLRFPRRGRRNSRRRSDRLRQQSARAILQSPASRIGKTQSRRRSAPDAAARQRAGGSKFASQR